MLRLIFFLDRREKISNMLFFCQLSLECITRNRWQHFFYIFNMMSRKLIVFETPFLQALIAYFLVVLFWTVSCKAKLRISCAETSIVFAFYIPGKLNKSSSISPRCYELQAIPSLNYAAPTYEIPDYIQNVYEQRQTIN